MQSDSIVSPGGTGRRMSPGGTGRRMSPGGTGRPMSLRPGRRMLTRSRGATRPRIRDRSPPLDERPHFQAWYNRQFQDMRKSKG